jgi:hypothetical protein
MHSRTPLGVKLTVCDSRDSTHVETNPLTNLLEDLAERTEALRGYL